MTLRAKLSRFIRRWITPADAAHVVSKHGAEARRLTLAELQAAMRAQLADETARFGPLIVPRRSQLQSYGEG